MQQNRPFIDTPPPIDGDVFARQQRFMTLSRNLQEDAKQFRSYIEQDKSRLFQTHYHALVKSVYSVKGKDLIDAISQWLQTHYASVNHAAVQTGPSHGLAGVHADQPHGTFNRAGAAVAPSSTKIHAHDVTKEQLQSAKKVAEALVFIGFITPYNDDHTHFSFIAPEHYVHDHDIDSELFIPVAPSVTELMTTSVWSVADGAVYARALKRKAGVLGQIDDGKDVYVVLNDYTKKTYLFASDLAREPIAEMSGSTMSVRYDNSHFQFGVRVCQSLGRESDKPELFNAETKELQEEFMNACVHIGAKYAVGGVKQMIDAYESGLIGRDAVLGDQNKYLDLTTEPHEVAMASSAATLISSEREVERNPQTSKRYHEQEGFPDTPKLGHQDSQGIEHQGRQDDLYPTATSTDYVGNEGRGTTYPTSTGEHQNRTVGEKASDAMHGDRRTDGSYPATSSTAERHGHHSISTEYPNQQGGSYPTAAERQNRTVGEKVSDAVHGDRRDTAYPAAATTTTAREGHHHGVTGHSTSPAYDQSIGSSYPTNERQQQKPTVGERVSSAMHGNRHDSAGAYTSTSEDLHSHRHHDSSYPTSTEYPNQQGSAHPTTSTTDEHKKPSIGERLKSALHRDHNKGDEGSIPTTSEFQSKPVGAYPNPSQPRHHDHSVGGRSSTGFQNQQAGSYPPATTQQQNPMFGEKVSSKLHRGHHDNTDGAYQTSKKYEDSLADDAPHAETRLADVPIMTKHNENGVDVYYAPQVAP
ncbi:Phospholipid hydroperoxide glutathione [Globisporangium polare]